MCDLFSRVISPENIRKKIDVYVFVILKFAVLNCCNFYMFCAITSVGYNP